MLIVLGQDRRGLEELCTAARLVTHMVSVASTLTRTALVPTMPGWHQNSTSWAAKRARIGGAAPNSQGAPLSCDVWPCPVQ